MLQESNTGNSDLPLTPGHTLTQHVSNLAQLYIREPRCVKLLYWLQTQDREVSALSLYLAYFDDGFQANNCVQVWKQNIDFVGGSYECQNWILILLVLLCIYQRTKQKHGGSSASSALPGPLSNMLWHCRHGQALTTEVRHRDHKNMCTNVQVIHLRIYFSFV